MIERHNIVCPENVTKQNADDGMLLAMVFLIRFCMY